MVEESTKTAFLEALLSSDRIRAADIAGQACPTAETLPDLEELISHSLERIGEDWETGACALAQIYMAGIICEEILAQAPIAQERIPHPFPRMAIGVLMDHHSLGKKLVLSVIRATGYEILDFGCGLSVEELVERTLAEKVEVLLVSTLMYPSALRIRLVRERLGQVGCHPFLIVGGAPFRLDRDLWRRVGADADGGNATGIVDVLRETVGVGYGE